MFGLHGHIPYKNPSKSLQEFPSLKQVFFNDLGNKHIVTTVGDSETTAAMSTVQFALGMIPSDLRGLSILLSYYGIAVSS